VKRRVRANQWISSLSAQPHLALARSRISIGAHNQNGCASTSNSVPDFLLVCGVALGPLFYVVVVLQILTRTGFDIRRHPLSLLSLGDAGWIQIANFILTGLLAVACSVGVRRALRNAACGTWGPLLIATYGLGMIVAGLFPPDQLLGFPPGALLQLNL
jgi:Protein of unknown function (DUF998)